MMHLISWKKVCNHRSFGELTIRKATLMNKAFFIKLAWRLIWNDSSIWAQILTSKYNFNLDSKFLSTMVMFILLSGLVLS